MEISTGESILKGDITNSDESSFFSLLNIAVSKNTNKPAVLYRDDNGAQKTISFKSFDELSNRIANVLKRYCNYSKASENIIAVSLKPTEHLPIILLAILKAGISYLPIDVESPVDRIKHILQDAQPLMFITEDTADADIYTNILTFTVNHLLVQSEHMSEEIAIDENVSNIVIILYTSGSTGTPKGVRLTYTALMNRLMWQWKTLPYDIDEEYCIFKTALTFVDSVCEIWGPLLQGRTLIVIPRQVTKDPEKFTTALNKYKIQRIVLVPSLLKSLLIYLRLQQDKESLRMLKLWICSGETLTSSLVQEFFLWFSGKNKTLANFYGSTEIMGDVTYYLITENDQYLKDGRIPIGKPINNCSVYIVDQHLNLLPPGEVGELLIAGKNLADGYLHDKNSHKFMKNPFSSKADFSKVFRTGDYAKINNNLLFYEGRQDNQVKIRGHRVDLTEIEKAVLRLTLVKDAVVLSYKTDESEQVLVCFVVPEQTQRNIGVKDIKCLLEQTLLSYMIPEIIIMDNIPLLTNGKTDRQKLLQFYKILKHENEQTNYNFDGVPMTHLTKASILLPTLASVIGLSDKRVININSNFYELGGNSLNAIYAVLKLREKGFHIGITDFITSKSIKDILFILEIDSSTGVNEDVNPEQNILEMMNDNHKKEVTELLAESFFTKGDLDRLLKPGITKQDYLDFYEELWDPMVKQNLSFVLKCASTNRILAAAVNFNASDEPEIVAKSKLHIILDFLEYLERPLIEHLLQENDKIFHNFVLATSDDLSPSENIILIRLMEEKCIELAKKNHFSGMFSSNTSPLTQQLATGVFNYNVLLDYQVNQYVTSDGTRPFAEFSDDQRAIVSWKEINYQVI